VTTDARNRKTGVSVQDTGQRNEDGFEDLDNFFSPEKASAPPVPAHLESSTHIEQTATEATMQLAMSMFSLLCARQRSPQLTPW
jgi:hypothetical protein